MAITSLHHVESSSHVAQRGDVSSITDRYIVETDSDMTVSTLRTSTFTGLPHVRDRHAVSVTYVCQAVDITPLSFRVWQFVARWTTRISSTSHVRMARRGALRDVRIWRQATAPTSGDAVWFPTSAIAGTAVDVMGEPEILRFWRHELTLDVSIDSAAMKSQQGTADYWQVIWTAALRRRNSVAYLGYAAGAVVFLGWSEQMTEDPWVTASLHFVADELYHLEQRVLPAPDGSILLGSTTTVAGTPIRQASNVYWYQPYRETRVDLYELWPTAELTVPTPAYAP